jgi:hypothetical protein
MKIQLAILSLLVALGPMGCGKKSDVPSSPASVAAANPDAASPLDKPYRLKGGAEVDVDRLFEILPLYLRPTYEKAVFDKKLGATVVTNLKFGDVAASKGFTARRAEFYGVNLDKIESLQASTDAPVDAPLELVLAKLRLFDVASIGAGHNSEETTIGGVEIDSLRIRRGGIPKSSPSSGLAAFFNSFDVAGVYFKDIRATGGDIGTTDTGAAFDITAPDVRFVGLGGGKLKSLLARDLDYLIRQSPDAIAAAGRGLGPAGDILVNGPLRNFIAPENQRTKLKTLEWKDISFAGLMAYGLKGERPPLNARNLINLGTLRLTDAETFIGDKRLSIVPETVVSAMEFTWLAPSKIRAVTRGGQFDFTAYLNEYERVASDGDALQACQKAIKDAGAVSTPKSVPNSARGSEFYFAWPTDSFSVYDGNRAQIPASASCVGSLKTCQISSITLNGADILESSARFDCKKRSLSGPSKEQYEKAITILKSRNLDKVKGDSDLAFDWNADRGDAVLSTGFESTGFADFDFDLAVEGLELAKIEAGRAAGAAQPVADLARLRSFSVVIKDEELLDAFYALSALQTGGTAKDMRAATPAMMRFGKLELQRDNPRMAGYVDALADFLEDGGTLEISAAPETPVPFNALGAAASGGPDAMAAAINLTVTRKK